MPQLSFHTPFGPVAISEEDNVIVAIDWGWGRDQTHTPFLSQAREQLSDYFDGFRRTLSLPYRPFGTDFQRRTWNAIAAIPYGQTCNLHHVAAVADGSAQAVSRAINKNPIPILIPCHRVTRRLGSAEAELNRHLIALESEIVRGMR